VAAPTFLNTSPWMTAMNTPDLESLYDMLVTLRKTGKAAELWSAWISRMDGLAEVTSSDPDYPSFYAAYAAAVAAAYESVYVSRGVMMHKQAITASGSKKAWVNLTWSKWRFEPSGLTTEVGKTVKVWEQFKCFAGWDFYNPMSIPYAGAAESYVLADTISLGLAAGGTGATLGATGEPAYEEVDDPSWPASPGTNEAQEGALILSGTVVLVEWSFEFV
jgi:hypothetical protein